MFLLTRALQHSTSTRLLKEYQPSHSPTLSAHRIIDAVLFLGTADNTALTDRLIQSSGLLGNINHFQCDGLSARPVAVAIETKTESRTVQEAKVQLGVWVAAHIARLEKLIDDLDGNSTSMSVHPEASALAPSWRTNHLHRLVLPLVVVSANSWTLHLARPKLAEPTSFSASASSLLDTRRPKSTINIMEATPMGGTRSITEVYNLLRCLAVLQEWIDVEYRRWWEELLLGKAGQ